MTIRLLLQEQATVDANGNCTIAFPAPSSGMVYTGTVTITSTAKIAGQWIVKVNTQPIDTIQGSQSLGNVQCFSSEPLELDGTGLSPGSTVSASYVGFITTEEATNPVAINGDSPTSVDGVLLGLFTVTTDPAQVFVVPVPTYVNYLQIGILSSNNFDAIEVSGTTTGFVSLPSTVIGTQRLFVIPIEPFDSSQQLLYNSSTTGQQVWVIGYNTPPVGLKPDGSTIVAPNTTVATPKSVVVAAGSTGIMIPTPAVGTINHLTVLSLSNSLATAGPQVVELYGDVSGQPYFFTMLPVAAGVATEPAIEYYATPLDINVNEQIDIAVGGGGGGTGNVRFTLPYEVRMIA